MTQIKEILDELYDLNITEILDRRSWDIPFIVKNDPLVLVLKILKTNDHVWVVENKENRLLRGVITENDLIKSFTPPELLTYSYGRFSKKVLYNCREIDAQQLMNRKLVTCDSKNTVREVIIKMLDYRIRRVPLLEDGKLVGEVTIKNLIDIFLIKLTKFDQDAGG